MTELHFDNLIMRLVKDTNISQTELLRMDCHNFFVRLINYEKYIAELQKTKE